MSRPRPEKPERPFSTRTASIPVVDFARLLETLFRVAQGLTTGRELSKGAARDLLFTQAAFLESLADTAPEEKPPGVGETLTLRRTALTTAAEMLYHAHGAATDGVLTAFDISPAQMVEGVAFLLRRAAPEVHLQLHGE